MNRRIKLLFLLSIMTIYLLPSTPCFAIQYNIVDLGTLNGETQSKAYAINEHGVVVGYNGSDNDLDSEGAFIWQNGVMAEIKDQSTNEIMSSARGINDNGQIVGGNSLYYNGTITNLGSDIYPIDINNSGEIVGISSSPSQFFLLKDNNISYFGVRQGGIKINDNSTIVGTAVFNGKVTATRWDNNQSQKLHELDPSYYPTRHSSVFDVNNNGTVVGYFNGVEYPNYPNTSNRTKVFGAVKWDDDGQMTVLNSTDSSVVARAINDNGQIVGDFNYTNTNTGGFYWSENLGFQDLNSLIENNSDWTISEVWDINDSGQVVGFGLNPDNETHGFLLDPVDQWEYIAEAQDVLDIDFTEMEIDNIYDLWASGKKDENPDPIEINDEIWEYFDEEFPDRTIGETWFDDQYRYIYLGSGVKSLRPTQVPEPITLILFISSLLGLVFNRIKK